MGNLTGKEFIERVLRTPRVGKKARQGHSETGGCLALWGWAEDQIRFPALQVLMP